MAGIKTLIKETAVYGLSSIVGRFLNWCLVPLYVYIFPTEEYGIVSFLYAFTAVALVILNYGMETGFFRYANSERDPERVYTTSLLSVGFTSISFIALITLFINPVTDGLKLPGCELYVWLLAVTVGIDAFTNLPFAYLRFKKKAFTFAGIKLANVGINIGLNIFFLLCCPSIHKSFPALIDWFYVPAGGQEFGIGWIFVANILSTVCVLLMLLPQILGRKYVFSGGLLRKMLKYSWPLLILGVAGILSQNMGQMLIPYLFPGNEAAAQSMVGIYGANIKIAIVMVMFTQAFRYAYEPFIFSQAKSQGEEKTKAYADAMKFFVIFGFFIFLGVMFFLPVLKYFISKSYWAGLQIVPIMMMAELFFGVFFNLSLWYKLTDRTQWGMYFSLFGFVVMLGLNVWFVPAIGIPNGYVGSAWAAFIAYFAMMTVSYFIGRKYYPIDYELKKIGGYTVLAIVLYAIGSVAEWESAMWGTYAVRIVLLCVYLYAVLRFERLPLPFGRGRKISK
ncbi:MAG: polysaccharide biosynthesis C-terminal domain-containing protein [Muribaculaceae bacterium]|nr:polysaccharide biosynthesis C-terminal domain-containing protein [Muribaculaceae bacterium]